LESSQCYTTDVVLTEVIFVLEKVYEAPRAEIGSVIKRLMARPDLICNRMLMNEVIDLYEEQRSLSIVDCYTAVEARTFANNMVTFDKNLLKHGGSHVTEP
jgi:predicted nucleic-acid-binding protein